MANTKELKNHKRKELDSVAKFYGIPYSTFRTKDDIYKAILEYEKKNKIKDPKRVKKSAGTASQKTKIDWFEARKRYLSNSTVSYADIADEFGVSKTSVEARARSEGWVELRQELGEKAFNELTEKLVNIKTTANDRHLKHYQNLQAIANMSIQDMAERSFERDRKGRIIIIDGKPIPKPVNPFELEKLAKALKTSIDGERVVLGLPTSVSALTDSSGGDVWSGLADLFKEADKVIEEYESNRDKSSGGDKEAS